MIGHSLKGARARKKWGLDKPIWQQYVIWLSNVLRGDLGYSYMTGRPVAELVFGRIPHTIELALSSLLFALILAVPLGVLAAVKQNSIFDRIVTSFSVVANSLPSFWIGIIMIVIFSVELGWFPTSGAGLGKGLSQHVRSLILPMLVLGFSARARQFIMRVKTSSKQNIIERILIIFAFS